MTYNDSVYIYIGITFILLPYCSFAKDILKIFLRAPSFEEEVTMVRRIAVPIVLQFSLVIYHILLTRFDAIWTLANEIGLPSTISSQSIITAIPSRQNTPAGLSCQIILISLICHLGFYVFCLVLPVVSSNKRPPETGVRRVLPWSRKTILQVEVSSDEETGAPPFTQAGNFCSEEGVTGHREN